MEFTLTQDFPAGLDRLWAVFGRPEYPQSKYLALGATAIRMQGFHATSRAIEVALERDMPVDRSRLPLWLHWLAGSQQTLQQRAAWRRLGPKQTTAELDVRAVGLPVQAHGNGTLVEPGPDATRMVLNWCVTSTLGQRVEHLFADQVRAALEHDHAFTLA